MLSDTTLAGMEHNSATRTALRALLEARLAGRELPSRAIAAVNAAAAAAPISPRLELVTGGPHVVQWGCTATDDGAWALAAAARSAIDLIAAEPANRLRRCANSGCSMLFAAETVRRVWCAPNLCGNRARVARHYRRHRRADAR